ncbi:MAG: hypothetical protein ACI8QI_000703 [Limisphaerales bacterium]|jgi:hypothetical protein
MTQAIKTDNRHSFMAGKPISARPQSNAPPAICLEETGVQTDAGRDPVLRFFHSNSNLICPWGV